MLTGNRKVRFLLLLVVPIVAFGCNGKPGEKTDADNAEKTGKTPTSAKTEKTVPLAHRLLPANTLGYVRLNDIQRVRVEFIHRKHVKDADRIREQVNGLIQAAIQAWGRNGNALGINTQTLLQLIVELDVVHFGVSPAKSPAANSAGSPEPLVVLEFTERSGLDALLSDLKPKLSTSHIAGTPVKFVEMPQGPKAAFYLPDPRTIVLGTETLLGNALRRLQDADGKSLADSSRFQQTLRDWGEQGELFTYANLGVIREMLRQNAFPTVSHVAASLRIDGGLSLRAYAAGKERFPKFLVRTPREKKFLRRIPADAVFLLSAGTESGKQTRRNFVEWINEQIAGGKRNGTTMLPQSWRDFAAAYSADSERIESEAFVIIQDLWLAVLPVKSESALFIAPDSTGRWGAAFLFDIEDKQQVEQLTKRVFQAGQRAELPWKQTTHEGLTIHYIDFAEVAKDAGKPVPPEVAQRAQLQVGYAENDELFFVGTLDAIKFAHQPTGKTLDSVLTYNNVDAQNAIMLSLQPGRILHRTFGVPQVDEVLKRLATQIPKETNYAVTLNFEPRQLTFRTNIPFPSLIAWMITEWQGTGPAGLRKVLRNETKAKADQ